MGRPLRSFVAGGFYHVTARGNDRRAIYADADDRHVFLGILDRVGRRYGWRIHALCLMGNHYHVVVETPVPNLSAGMRDLNGDYARGFNDRRGSRDHVFGRRFWAEPIEDDSRPSATQNVQGQSRERRTRPARTGF